MAVNFCQQSYLKDHLFSALKEDCIICLNRITSKDLLLCYICTEFLRQTGRSCLVLCPSEGPDRYHGFQSWVELLTVFQFKKLQNSNDDCINDKLKIYAMSMDAFLTHNCMDAPLNSLSSVIVDMTNADITEEKFSLIRSIFDIFHKQATRFIVLFSITSYTNNAASVSSILNKCSKHFPILLKIAGDSVAIGCNGSKIQSFTAMSDDTPTNESALLRIREELEACSSFFKLLNEECHFSKREYLLNFVNDLQFVLERFGPASFAFCLDELSQFIETNRSEILLDSLMFKFLKTKHIVMEVHVKKYFHQKRQLKLVHSCLEKALKILQDNLEVIEDSKDACQRIAIIVDSKVKARVLFLTLQELKITSSFDYLNKLSILLVDAACNGRVNAAGSSLTILTTSHMTNQGHTAGVNLCMCFDVPKDYGAFMKIKRLLAKREGTLQFILPPSDANVMKLREFEEVENLLLKQIPTYIKPLEAKRSIENMEIDSISFEPDSETVTKNPADSVHVINRYCSFLATGKSGFAVNSDFEFWTDNSSSYLCGRTKIHFPAKSMVIKPVPAPSVTLPLEKHDLTDVKILSRIATCLEACKMLRNASEIDDALLPTRRLNVPADGAMCQDASVALTTKSFFLKHIPQLLTDSFPQPGSRVYVYKVETVNYVTEIGSRFERWLGFCTSKKLPTLPSFVIYKRREKLLLQIAEVATETLTHSNIQCLVNFHRYVLNNILKYETDPSYDCGTLKNGLLWTVLEERDVGFSIDHRFLESILLPRDGSLATDIYLDLSGNVQDAIVLPRHRRDQDVFYIVEGICKNMTPIDTFPNRHVAKTYLEYYEVKYDIKLKHDQYMVNVRSRGKNVNFLQKRFTEDESAEMGRSKRGIVFPQELCLVHPVPAYLWEQIDTIPVVIHRLTSLLLIMEFQDLLCKEVGLSCFENHPTIDDSIYLSLNEAHKRRDTAMLRRIENNSVRSKLVLDNMSPELNAITDPLKSSKDQRMVDEAVTSCLAQSTADSQSSQHYDHSVFGSVKGVVQQRLVPPVSFLLVALTSVDAGDLFDCEKLAILGDAFLCFAVSVHLFFQNRNEHAMSQERGVLVSNMMLYRKGNAKNLWKYLLEDRFDYKSNLMVKKVLNCATTEHVENAEFQQRSDCLLAYNQNQLFTKEANDNKCTLQPGGETQNPPIWLNPRCLNGVPVGIRNKAIADSVEALIGACFLYSGEEVALDFMRWLGYDLHWVRKEADQSHGLETNSHSDEKCRPHHIELISSGISLDFNGSKLNKLPSCLQDLSMLSSDAQTNPSNYHPCAKGQPGRAECPHLPAVSSKIIHYEGAAVDDIKYAVSPPVGLQTGCRDTTGVYVAMKHEDFENRIDYAFRNKAVLAEAFLHPSYCRALAPETNCNQRLEFLGDSILYLLVTDYLCRKYPIVTIEELTVMRQVVISTRTLATVAILNDFQKYMMALSPEMCYQLKDWSDVIIQKKAERLLWPKLTMPDAQNYHTVFSKESSWPATLPKDMADVFESVAAAIYIDSGDIQSVWKSYYPLLKDVLDSLPPPKESPKAGLKCE